MRPFVTTTFVALLLVAFAPGRASFAAPLYDFVNFDVPGAQPGSTLPGGINNAGQVVGYYSDSSGTPQGFLRAANGSYTTLSDPAATDGTVAQGINSSGQIVGEYYSGTSRGIRASGFLFDPASGIYTNFDDPGAPDGTYFQGINAAGSIVGYSVDADSNTQGLLLSSIGGTLTKLIEPDAASIVFPSGYATPYRTVAYGINDAGLIAGAYSGIDNSYGFVRGTDGSYIKLRDPLATGATSANGINNVGQVVGTYFACCSYPKTIDGFQSFVFDLSSGTYTTLHDPAATDMRFISGNTFAYGINDSGQVVGIYGTNVGFSGFIATPEMAAVPEPASLALLSVGVIGLVTFRWGSRTGRAPSIDRG